MAKLPKDPTVIVEENDAFEMIELTCDELETLTKAFNMIDEVCRELQSADAADDEADERPFSVH